MVSAVSSCFLRFLLPSTKRRRESSDTKPVLTAETQVLVIRRMVAELIRGPKQGELTFGAVQDPSSILEKTIKFVAAVQHLEKAVKARAKV